MELMTAIGQRRSVREYTQQPLTQGTLREIIKAATEAPSAVNEQPWRFTVVSDKQLMARMSKDAKSHMLQGLTEAASADRFRTMLGDAKFNIFYDAPALVVISAPRTSQWAIEDCALAAENLMLAARSMNLGSCWIGFAQQWLGTKEGHAAIQLDESQLPVAPIIVGHPQGPAPAIPRREPVIQWIG